MAKTGKKQLRAAWLQVHKWIGLTLAILIIPISLTGSALGVARLARRQA